MVRFEKTWNFEIFFVLQTQVDVETTCCTSLLLEAMQSQSPWLPR